MILNGLESSWPSRVMPTGLRSGTGVQNGIYPDRVRKRAQTLSSTNTWDTTLNRDSRDMTLHMQRLTWNGIAFHQPVDA